jgi:hypothetical protein
MKKTYILFFLIFNIMFFIHAQGEKIVMGEFIRSGNRFILNLPYEIGDEVRTVFDEDTPLAIDIIEICADGKPLSFIEDFGTPLGRTSFSVNGITRGKNEYYISMFWRSHLGEALRWNDGRGIIFVEIAPNLFAHKTNTYEISQGMKVLEIRYRILLPYPSLTDDELYNQTYTGNFSAERKMIVDIGKIFERTTQG